jgi:hypothetical protein
MASRAVTVITNRSADTYSTNYPEFVAAGFGTKAALEDIVSVQPRLPAKLSSALSLSAILLSVACSPKAGQPRLPPTGAFTVSDYFAASGAMADGDGKSAPGMVVTTQYPGAKCGDKTRDAGARGACFVFDYVPGPNLFAGVYFQYPANNWGAEPGLPVHSDKFTQVSFKFAVSDNNQTLLSFGIGGIGYPTHTDADIAAGITNSDQFLSTDTPPTTPSGDWQSMSIRIKPAELPNVTDIIGAFAWYASYPMGSDFNMLPPTTVYIDDIVYE